MLRIGLISDTHISTRETRLPEAVFRAFAGVDLILHAGDITSLHVLEELMVLAPVHAVRGNMDMHATTGTLPTSRLIQREGRIMGLIHGWGAPEGIRKRIGEVFREQSPDIIVFGHTHEAVICQEENCLWINPGSPTRPSGNLPPSVGILDLEGEFLRARIIDLGQKIL